MEDPIVIKLKTPIQANGEEVTELRLRKPKGKDFRVIKDVEHPFDMILDFAASLAGVPPSTMDALEAEDVKEVTEAVGGFLAKFPVTGPK